MSDQIIRKLFETRLESWADENDVKLLHENETVTTEDAKALHAKVTLLPGRKRSVFLSGNDILFVGVFQVSISYPKRTGAGDVEAISKALSELYPVNLILTDTSGLSVQVTTPLQTPAAIENATAYVQPTSFEYRSHVTT